MKIQDDTQMLSVMVPTFWTRKKEKEGVRSPNKKEKENEETSEEI